MRATQLLHNLGQSLWLDNITRDLINSSTLERYIDELSVTRLTSNPTIFDHAIENSSYTMPEGTLQALANHGDLSEIMSADGGDCEAVLDQFAAAGIDIDKLAAKLQDDGAKSFVSSWSDLMEVIASKSGTLAKAG
jgi:transaldolase